MAAPQTQKCVFQIVSIVFVVIMIIFTIDFMTRTTRPGGKGQLKERIQKRLGDDSSHTKASERPQE